jgi:hypothetical protein
VDEMSDERKKTPARTRRTPAPEPQIEAVTPAPKRARAAAPKAPAKAAAKKAEAPAKTRAPRAKAQPKAAKAQPEVGSQAAPVAVVEPVPVLEPQPIAPEAQAAAANDTPPAPAVPEHELRELISRRATEIWLSHGGMRQGSIEDWLQAEAEVRRTLEGIAS